jgi:Mycothiol maleylpyruvate isomerase N-terminal domain
MQQAHRIDHQDSGGRPPLTDAARIPSLTHPEAAEMATVELERFLTLVESLAPADWERSTACPLWNVRQVVAHVTGAAAAYARWSQFKRQYSPFVQRPYR